MSGHEPNESSKSHQASRLIQLRLKEKDLLSIAELKTFFGTDNRTRVLRYAIKLTHMMTEAVEKGDRILILKQESGELEEITVLPPSEEILHRL